MLASPDLKPASAAAGNQETALQRASSRFKARREFRGVLCRGVKMEKGLRVGYPRFVAALDAWLLKANNTVPVSFCLGPHRTGKSDSWSEWSRANLATAVDVYLGTRTAAFDPATATKERHAHSFIFQTILGQPTDGQIRAEQIDALLANLDMVFEGDGILTAFNTYDIDDRRMAAQVELLHKVLSADVPNHTTWIQKLGPYTQLAYYPQVTVAAHGSSSR